MMGLFVVIPVVSVLLLLVSYIQTIDNLKEAELLSSRIFNFMCSLLKFALIILILFGISYIMKYIVGGELPTNQNDNINAIQKVYELNKSVMTIVYITIPIIFIFLEISALFVLALIDKRIKRLKENFCIEK